MDITVRVDDSGPYPVVDLTGPLEADSLDHVSQRLREIAAQGHTHLIVDLTDVTDIDAVGVGVLLDLVFTIGWSSARIVLVHPRPSVREEFDRTHLGRVFLFAATRAEAVLQLDRTH